MNKPVQLSTKNPNGKTISRFSIALELSKYSSRRKVNGMFLGAFWSFLEPFLLFIILVLLRNKLGSSDIPHFPLYLFSGLFAYQFFAQASRRIMQSLAAYSRYAKTFPLPLDTYIYATYFETLKDCSFQLLIIAGLVVWSGLNLIYLIPFVMLFSIFTLFVLGVGFFLAVLSAYLKDIEVIWGLICRVLFFATPIFYSVDFAPAIIKYNPLVPFLEIFRGVIIEGHIGLAMPLVSLLAALVTLICGRYFFHSMQKRIVEAI